MKAISLRMSMQTLSPCLTPSACKPLAMRAARSATSAWLRLRSPLMMPRKSEDVSVIALFSIGEHLKAAVMAGLLPPIHVLACTTKDVDHRDIWREDGASRLLPGDDAGLG